MLLHSIPSLLPLPSWAEVFAREDMKGEQPCDDEQLLIHICADHVNAEALKLTLERWPDSVNALTKVRALVLGCSVVGFTDARV